MVLSHEHRLVTYGTLAPGRVNHHQLADLKGTWQKGTVVGRLLDKGWGAVHGCRGIILDPSGEKVEVHIFESVDLPSHWSRLDEFEGEGYKRSIVEVLTQNGQVSGSIYELTD
ncbi:MAG: gamma-glutamylcyclotransferase family protein [Rhizobiaceae bacterium]